MSYKMLLKEHNQISKLPFEENEFSSMEYDLDSYPEVKKSIVEGLSDQGFELTERSEYPPRCAQITAGCFELQAHLKSVAEHTDHLSRELYFGIYVLKAFP